MDDYDICPKCGQKLLQGAMKCMACDTVLKTEEEQKAMIRKFMEPQKKFNMAVLRKIIIYLVVLGVIYYFYSEEMKAVIDYIARNLGSS